MEGLKELIRNLAYILLLATFLEMLLPNKSMRGFVQLVMGLFVIAAILNPLADLLNWGSKIEIPAWVASSSTDVPVLAAEEKAAVAGKTAVREQYRKILIYQIGALVSAIDEVQSSEVKVELEEGTGGINDYPQILRVDIVFSQKKTTIETDGTVKPLEPVEPVEPVELVVIGGNNNEQATDVTTGQTAKAKEVRKQIASLMQINEEIIYVQEKE